MPGLATVKTTTASTAFAWIDENGPVHENDLIETFFEITGSNARPVPATCQHGFLVLAVVDALAVYHQAQWFDPSGIGALNIKKKLSALNLI